MHYHGIDEDVPGKIEVNKVLGCIAAVCTEFRTWGATHLT